MRIQSHRLLYFIILILLLLCVLCVVYYGIPLNFCHSKIWNLSSIATTILYIHWDLGSKFFFESNKLKQLSISLYLSDSNGFNDRSANESLASKSLECELVSYLNNVSFFLSLSCSRVKNGWEILNRKMFKLKHLIWVILLCFIAWLVRITIESAAKRQNRIY